MIRTALLILGSRNHQGPPNIDPTFFSSVVLLHLLCSKLVMIPRSWLLDVAPRLRSAFSCAARAPSWRTSASNIFCLTACLCMLGTTSLEVGNGAAPGAAGPPPYSGRA